MQANDEGWKIPLANLNGDCEVSVLENDRKVRLSIAGSKITGSLSPEHAKELGYALIMAADRAKG